MKKQHITEFFNMTEKRCDKKQQIEAAARQIQTCYYSETIQSIKQWNTLESH